MRFLKNIFQKPTDEEDALLWRVSWLAAITAVVSGVSAGTAMYFSGAALVATGAAFALSATGIGLIVLAAVAVMAFVGGLLWYRQHQAKKVFNAQENVPPVDPIPVAPVFVAQPATIIPAHILDQISKDLKSPHVSAPKFLQERQASEASLLRHHKANLSADQASLIEAKNVEHQLLGVLDTSQGRVSSEELTLILDDLRSVRASIRKLEAKGVKIDSNVQGKVSFQSIVGYFDNGECVENYTGYGVERTDDYRGLVFYLWDEEKTGVYTKVTYPNILADIDDKTETVDSNTIVVDKPSASGPA